MNVTDTEKAKLAQLIVTHAGNLQALALAVYEEGIMQGSLRTAQLFAKNTTVTPSSNTNTNGDGDDDEKDSPLSDSDRSWLRAQGIDPDKKFRHKNSVFTITGVKRTRWKFPISATNQNGTRYKWPVANVKALQR